MLNRKPIIGILGGIGSGKSHVARLFGELGCLVINSDDQVRAAYRDPKVKQTLKEWWGDAVFDDGGEINRPAVARIVFAHPHDRKRLEAYIHPIVTAGRDRIMAEHADDSQVLAFVWDTPLLMETGAHKECDVLVFVDAPLEQRLLRVQQSRGWDAAELQSREKLQMPLDKKREISHYVLSNTAGTQQPLRAQVREVLSRILAVD